MRWWLSLNFWYFEKDFDVSLMIRGWRNYLSFWHFWLLFLWKHPHCVRCLSCGLGHAWWILLWLFDVLPSWVKKENFLSVGTVVSSLFKGVWAELNGSLGTYFNLVLLKKFAYTYTMVGMKDGISFWLCRIDC